MTIQTPEQVAEALERDDCKPWDEDFRTAVVAAIAADRKALLAESEELIEAMALSMIAAKDDPQAVRMWLNDCRIKAPNALAAIRRHHGVEP